MKSICVFLGSSPGRAEAYKQAAVDLGRLVAEQDRTLVYGGASVGLMGVLADAALEAGGRVVGVIPSALQQKEVAHNGLTELYTVASMHERKATMADLADGFIAMPGGLGTMEELFEALTWAQLGFHQKPLGLLNTAGYYDLLNRFLDTSVEQGFIRSEHRRMLLCEASAELLLSLMDGYRAPTVGKLISREEL